MRALTVIPREPGSGRVRDVPEPPAADGALLVETLAFGVCGTDHDLLAGAYGSAPPGEPYLIIGHESLGRVLEAPVASGFRQGDLVVGIVRRPDPVPCAACAHDEWDMCLNGRYTERGIGGRHGFGAERFRLEPSFAVAVDPALGEAAVLLEPASIVAKAWEHVQRVGARAFWEPRRVLVTGAGPVGLLAALVAVQAGMDVHVLDRVRDGVKPELVRALGATYHDGTVRDAAGDDTDVILECTGAPAVVMETFCATRANGIVCLAGLSTGSRRVGVDAARLNQELVLENHAILGVVNANRRHFEDARRALAAAPRGWLARLLTRRAPLDAWADAFIDEGDDYVKAIVVP